MDVDNPLHANAATTQSATGLDSGALSGHRYHSAMTTGSTSSYLASPITPGPASSQNMHDHRTAQFMTPEYPGSSLALTTRFLDHGQSVDPFLMPSTNISSPTTHVIRTASHELLLNNEGYRYLFARNNELLDSHSKLQRLLGEVQGCVSQQKDTLEELMGKLTIGNNTPHGSVQVHTLPELDPNDYPEITFWTRESWAPYLQNGEKYRLRNNEHHVRRYLQLLSGEIISKSRVAQMSADQRSLWVKYRTQGTMPETWSQAGADILEDFRAEMYRRYPELSYCKDHYKLALFAGDRYPSWIRHRIPTAMKIEDIKGDVHAPEDEDNKPHTVRVPKRARPASIVLDDAILPQTKHQRLAQDDGDDSDEYSDLISPTSTTAVPSRAISPHRASLSESRSPHPGSRVPSPCPTSRIPSPCPVLHVLSPHPILRMFSPHPVSRMPSPHPGVLRMPSPHPVSHIPSPHPVSRVLSPHPISCMPSPRPVSPAVQVPKASESTSTVSKQALPRSSIVDDPVRRKALADKLLHGGFDDPLDGTDTIQHLSKMLSSPALPPLPSIAPPTAIIPGSGPPMNASLTAAKSTKIRILKMGTTARNLAAVAYVKSNVNATADQFANYYDNLGPEDTTINETRQRFGQAHTARTPGATAEDAVIAFENASDDELKVFREAAIAHLIKPKKTRKDAKGKGKVV